MHLGYTVVTFNQASRCPDLEGWHGAQLHPDLESAKDQLEAERKQTTELGRRESHVICEVVELDEESLQAGAR